MSRAFDVAHLDELERLPVGEEGLVWRPVRRRFGIEAFGVNAYSAANAGDRVVEEHTETTNQHDELYFVVSGHAEFTVADETVDAPAGTFVFVLPETKRGAVAREAGTTVLAMGGRRGEPFQVSGWEYSFAAFGYHRAGETERGLEVMREGYEREPDHWAANYNFACLLSLAGHRDEALDKLERAVELNAEAAELAAGDSDFDEIRSDLRFESAITGQTDAAPSGS